MPADVPAMNFSIVSARSPGVYLACLPIEAALYYPNFSTEVKVGT
jgi:hypothetical protein